MMISLDGLRGTYDTQILQNLPVYCPSCPPDLVLSLVQAESSGNQFTNSGTPLTSSAGAIGLFQLEPATAAGLNVDPTNPAGNIQGGETYLQQLYNQFGNWPDALMAYNEGPGALQKQLNAGVTPTSSDYAAGILANAGIDTSGSPADSGDTGDSTDTTASTGGLSTMAWVAIAAAGLLLVGLQR